MALRILIIEDNAANLELMTYLLSAFGHTVITAADGGQGIEAARRERPDLIICDIQMPVMDGYEVARWLKSDVELRKTPLIAVTALAMVGDRDLVLAAGFDSYLTKPIVPETFVGQIESFLRLGQRKGSAIQASEPAPAMGDADPAGHVILVVDNLPVNLDLARSILEPSGYVVVTASNIAQALTFARGKHFDLILSDVCMAAGSGYDFLQIVRSDPKLRDIPFVLITSTNLNESDRAKGLALGAAQFLIRPIEPAVFLAEIRRCLKQ